MTQERATSQPEYSRVRMRRAVVLRAYVWLLRDALDKVRQGAEGEVLSKPLEYAQALTHVHYQPVPEVRAHAERLERLLFEISETPESRQFAAWQAVENAIRRLIQAVDTLPEVDGSLRGDAWRGRILVVDDDEDFLEVIAAIGSRQLMRMVCASTKEEAITLAKNHWLDGAILDVWMKDHEVSFDLAERLRRIPGNRDLPVAFLSGDTAQLNRLAAVRAGASLFLSKPLPENRFLDLASQLCAMRDSSGGIAIVASPSQSAASDSAQRLEARGISTHVVNSLGQLTDYLDQQEPNALLLRNWNRKEGLEAIRLVRTSPRWQDLPVLMVVPREDATYRLQALEAGCDDLIDDSSDSEEIAERVRIRMQQRQLRRARLETDPLTGLALRRSFLSQLHSRLSESLRHKQPLSLCMIDLDHFKAINDQHNHLIGDRVLARLGALLSSHTRAEDLSARWGGEEFVLAFPNQTASAITPHIEKLLADFSQVDFVGSYAFRTSFSGGLADIQHDGTTIEQLLAAADLRLYEAKRTGRAKIVAPQSNNEQSSNEKTASSSAAMELRGA